jgi:hypothetical protein
MTMDNNSQELLGEVYVAECTITGLKYVGQAQKYVTQHMTSWGSFKRWIRHCSEALDTKCKSYGCEISVAIREHGCDAFKVTKICDCRLEDMDKLEQFYIKEYDTLHPNGYNMTEGGSTGSKHCDLANKKNKENKKAISEKAKKNCLGNIGRRVEGTQRKREEDKNLPKYVSPIRKDNVIIGYMVKKFPMGIATSEYIYKTFKNKSNPAEALELAKAHVLILTKEYEDKLAKHQKEQAEHAKSVEVAKVQKLPTYIYPIITNDVITGYYVEGLKTFDGLTIPRRVFQSFTNVVNYEHSIRFVKLVNDLNTREEKPQDWLKVELPKNIKDNTLPTHIRYNTYKGEHSGYRVDYFVGYNDDKKQIVETKTFTSRKLSMEEKLQLAKNYVSELDTKYSKTKKDISS